MFPFNQARRCKCNATTTATHKNVVLPDNMMMQVFAIAGNSSAHWWRQYQSCKNYRTIVLSKPILENVMFTAGSSLYHATQGHTPRLLSIVNLTVPSSLYLDGLYGYLAQLTNLESLHTAAGPDLTFLASHLKLKRLQLRFTPHYLLNEVLPLHHLRDLRTLHITCEWGSPDISAISETYLPNLEILGLCRVPESMDLTPLGLLSTTLHTLNLGGGSWQNIQQPLSQLKQLRTLTLARPQDTGPHDIAVLAELLNLEELFLYKIPQVSSLQPLRALHHLEKLVVMDFPHLTCLDPLSTLPKLTDLQLYTVGGRLPIVMNAPLPNLTVFQSRGVHWTNLHDILVPMTKLQVIILDFDELNTDYHHVILSVLRRADANQIKYKTCIRKDKYPHDVHWQFQTNTQGLTIQHSQYCIIMGNAPRCRNWVVCRTFAGSSSS